MQKCGPGVQRCALLPHVGVAVIDSRHRRRSAAIARVVENLADGEPRHADALAGDGGRAGSAEVMQRDAGHGFRPLRIEPRRRRDLQFR